MDLAQLMIRFRADWTELDSAMNQSSSALYQWGNLAMRTGRDISLSMSLPLQAAAAASLKFQADFEKAMNRTEAIFLRLKEPADKFAETMKAVSDKALEVGMKTIYSSQQAAEGLANLAAAGFTAKQAMEGIYGVTSLAAVGNLKLADSAKIGASIIGQYGLAAKDLTFVADVMAKVSTNSITTVQELAFAFKYVGPAAKAAGISFTETATALQILANAGIVGSTAGTSLRLMFKDILDPTKRAAAVLNQLGLNLTDTTGKLLPLETVIRQVNNSTMTLSQGFTVFGTRFSTMLPLLQAGADKFKIVQKDMVDAAGTSKLMADTMKRGLAGSLEDLKSSVETLAIRIGTRLEPAMLRILAYAKETTTGLGSVVDVFSQLPISIQIAVGAFSLFIAGLGPVLYITGTLSRSISDMIGLFRLFGGSASSIASIIPAFLSTADAVRHLYTTVGTITFALQNGLVGALNTGELAVLRFGQAAGIAAAAFAGWNIGKVIAEQVGAVEKMSTAQREWVKTSTFGVSELLLGFTKVSDKISDVVLKNEFLKKTFLGITSTGDQVEQLRSKLAALGVTVEKGSSTNEQYISRLMQAAATLSAQQASSLGYYTSLGTAQQAVNALTQKNVDLVTQVNSAASLGTADKEKYLAYAQEIKKAMTDTVSAQSRLNESVKAGLISKVDQIKQEKDLAQGYDLLKGALKNVNEHLNQHAAITEDVSAKNKAAKEELRLYKQQLTEFASATKAVGKILNDMPASYEAYARSMKADDLPSEWRKQESAIESLRKRIDDLKITYNGVTDPKLKAEFRGQLAALEASLIALRDYTTEWRKEDIVKSGEKATAAVKSLTQAGSEGAKKAIDTMAEFALGLNVVKFAGDANITMTSDWVTKVEKLREGYKLFLVQFEEQNRLGGDVKVTYSDLLTVQREMLKAQIELAKRQGTDWKALEEQLKGTEKQLDSMGIKLKGMKETLTPLGIELKRVFSSFRDDLVRSLATANGFGDAFTKMLDNLKEAGIRFVVDMLINGLYKWLIKGQSALEAFGGTWTSIFGGAKKLVTSVTGAVKNVGGAIDGLLGGKGNSVTSAVSGTISSTASDAAGLSLDENGLSTIANPVAAPGGDGGGVISQGLKGLTTNLKSLVSTVSGFANIANSIFGGLSYLQGRRQEQDTARIEVTTRGMLNVLLQTQDLQKRFLPYLQGLADRVDTWQLFGGSAISGSSLYAAPAADVLGAYNDNTAALNTAAEGTQENTAAIIEATKATYTVSKDLQDQKDAEQTRVAAENKANLELPQGSTLPGSGAGNKAPDWYDVSGVANLKTAGPGSIAAQFGLAVGTAWEALTEDAQNALIHGHDTYLAWLDRYNKAEAAKYKTLTSADAGFWTDSNLTANQQKFDAGAKAMKTSIGDFASSIGSVALAFGDKLADVASTVGSNLADAAGQLSQVNQTVADRISWLRTYVQSRGLTGDISNPIVRELGLLEDSLNQGNNAAAPNTARTFQTGPLTAAMLRAMGGTINLNVVVNNADGQSIANEMVDTWRLHGMDI